MHEMSLCESTLSIIEEYAQTQNFKQVKSVLLEIGQLSAVEPMAMRFCFAAVTRGTIAEGAELQIVETPGKAICLDCGAHVAMRDKYGLCPDCGSASLQITAGENMRVINLEVL